MSARGFLGAGDLYIERIVGGTRQPRKGPYESTKFEIKPNILLKELASRGKATYGQVLESVALPQPSEFTVDLAEVDRAGLALALLATEEALVQAGGTLTDELTTALALNEWVSLTKQNLTGAFVLKNNAGSTTYVSGTDYTVNKALGMWKPLVGGAITAAQADLKATSTYGATSSGYLLRGGTQAQLRARFVLDGINMADQLPSIVTVHEGIIAANTAFDFLADNFNTLSLPGKMKTPTGGTEPFTVELRSTATAA